jgi:hypothetical protein
LPPKSIKIKIYTTIILPVVSYGCETCSHTWKDKQRLKVFKNRMLKHSWDKGGGSNQAVEETAQ